jgi:hypothetical protein
MTDKAADFFISRAGADADFAAVIGQILEGAGFSVILQQWDFADRNFMERMQAALGKPPLPPYCGYGRPRQGARGTGKSLCCAGMGDASESEGSVMRLPLASWRRDN